MQDIKKLKKSIEASLKVLSVYKDGFDAIKELEAVFAHKDELEKSIADMVSEESNYAGRVERAKAEAERIEKAYTERAEECDNSIVSDIRAAEKRAAAIIEDASEEHKTLQARVRKLNASIKDKEAREAVAIEALAKAEGELDQVRSRLKSI